METPKPQGSVKPTVKVPESLTNKPVQQNTQQTTTPVVTNQPPVQDEKLPSLSEAFSTSKSLPSLSEALSTPKKQEVTLENADYAWHGQEPVKKPSEALKQISDEAQKITQPRVMSLQDKTTVDKFGSPQGIPFYGQKKNNDYIFKFDKVLNPDVQRGILQTFDETAAGAAWFDRKMPSLSLMDYEQRDRTYKKLIASGSATGIPEYTIAAVKPKVNYSQLATAIKVVDGQINSALANSEKSLQKIKEEIDSDFSKVLGNKESKDKKILQYNKSVAQVTNEQKALDLMKSDIDNLPKPKTQADVDAANKKIEEYNAKLAKIKEMQDAVLKSLPDVSNGDSGKEEEEKLNKKIEEYNNILSQDLMANIYRKYKDQPEIYEEVIASDLQYLRNKKKYDVYVNSGYANKIDETLPDEVKQILTSDEYLASTPSTKKMYVEYMYNAIGDKLNMHRNDFYKKVSNTFTPSIHSLFLKQAAKERLPEAERVAQRWVEQSSYDPMGSPIGALATLFNKSTSGKALDLYKRILSADFDNESSFADKATRELLENSRDAIPFLGSVMGIADAVDMRRIINKEKVNGYKSLSDDDKVIYDAYSMFNSYSELSKPDAITNAFRSAPSFIAFVGELAAGGAGSAQFMRSLINGNAKKFGNLVAASDNMFAKGVTENLKAIDYITNGSLTTLAKRGLGISSYIPEKMGQAFAVRSQAAIQQALNMSSDTPILSFDEVEMIHQNLPSQTGIGKALAQSYALEASTIAMGDLAHGIQGGQNWALGRLAAKLPEGSSGRNLLRYINANEVAKDVALAYEKMGIAADKSMIADGLAKRLNLAGLPAELIAFGPAHARLEHQIMGTKDDLLTQPIETLRHEFSESLAGLVIPTLFGRATSTISLLRAKKALKPFDMDFYRFEDIVAKAPRVEFMRPSNLESLFKQAESRRTTRNRADKEKNVVPDTMRAIINERIAFEEGKIEGADTTQSFESYWTQLKMQQSKMNSLIGEINSGKVAAKTLEKLIKESPNGDWRQQFEFHRDLVNGYASAQTTKTLGEYVKDAKKGYEDVKAEIVSFDRLYTAPDMERYSQKIDELMMPDTYKSELRQLLENTHNQWKEENRRYTPQEDLSQRPTLFTSENTKHRFIQKVDGSYRFETSDSQNAIADLTFDFGEMLPATASTLLDVVMSSNAPLDVRQSVSEIVKQKIIDGISNAELAGELGGKDNLALMLRRLNSIAQSSALTVDQKKAVYEGLKGILLNEVKSNFEERNFETVKSTLVNAVQNSKIFEVSDVIELQRSVSRQMNSEAKKTKSVEELIEEAYNGDQESVEEIEQRINDKTLLRQNEVKQMAIEAIRQAKINYGKSFELLKENNKSFKSIDKQLNKLVENKSISEDAANIIRGIMTILPSNLIKVNRVVAMEGKDASDASHYSPPSKTITIKYKEGISEERMLGEIVEEMLHAVHHNLASSIALGGVGRDFVLTGEQVSQITGLGAGDAITQIAEWWKSKDFNYNEWIAIKSKPSTERNEYERRIFAEMKNMLLWYGQRYGQKWDKLDFKDDANEKMGWRFTERELVENFNRFMQFRRSGYSAYESHYYSAYQHEYFARAFADFYIADIANRVAGGTKVAQIIDKMSEWSSRNVKLPILQRIFGSETVKGKESSFFHLMSQYDIDEMKRINSTIGEMVNEAQREAYQAVALKVDFDSQRYDINSLPEQYGNILKSGNAQAKDNFYFSVLRAVKELGHDASMADDIMQYLTKEVNLGASDLGAARGNEVVYVSNTLRALENLPFNKTSSKQWEQKLLSTGANKNEMKRYGLDYFFETNKNPTKNEILEFLADKVIKVKDVILGGEIDKETSELNKIMEDAKNSLFYYGIDPAGIEGNTSIERRDGNTVVIRLNSSGIEKVYDSPESLVGTAYAGGYRFSIDNAKEVFNNANDWFDAYDKWINSEVRNTEQTHWSSYTTFPLNNYRELLPVIDTDKKLFSHEAHFRGIQNQLYHNRLNDVVSESGKKLLLSEEMQGDWTQANVKNISKVEVDLEYWTKEVNYFESKKRELEEEFKTDSFTDRTMRETFTDVNEKRLEVARQKQKELLDALPGAKLEVKKKQPPYEKTSDWVRAAIKRMIHMAVAEGKDGIAWTPAHVQVERWSGGMRDVVDEIQYEVYPDAISIKGNLQTGIEQKTNKQIIVRGFKNGENQTGALTFVEVDGRWLDEQGHSMQETFGTEISKQMIDANESGSISGENIIVGGQGYIDIYDKTAVDVANKLGKKYGVSVGSEEVKERFVKNKETGYVDEGSKDAANIKVHSLIFNEQMRNDISEQEELLIYAKRKGEGAAAFEPFRSEAGSTERLLDFEKEKSLYTYRGLHALDGLKVKNPKKYEELMNYIKDIEKIKKDFSIGKASSKDIFKGNFSSGGWYIENLLGMRTYRSEISDNDMEILSKPKANAPAVVKSAYETLIDNAFTGAKLSQNEAQKLAKITRSYPLELKDIISHKELFDSYPQIEGTKVIFDYDGAPDTGAWKMAFDKYNNTILVNSAVPQDKVEFTRSLLHEIQHKIDSIEGAFYGSSPDYFKNTAILYNIGMLARNGDAFMSKVLEKPENKKIKELSDKAMSGEIISNSEFDVMSDFFGGSKFKEFKDEAEEYLLSHPEYQVYKELYYSTIGEIVARDVESRYGKDFATLSLPATLALTLGGSINNTVKNITERDTVGILGAARQQQKFDKADLTWFNTMFDGKGAKVKSEYVSRAIEEIDNNIQGYGKNIADAKKSASLEARSLVLKWRDNMIKTELPKVATYKLSDIKKLTIVPFRRNIDDYNKDIKYIDMVVTNANFSKALAETSEQQRLARNRFLRNMKGSVDFYSAVKKLTDINLKMFESEKELNDFKELVSQRKENVVFEDFKQSADQYWEKYLDWKKQFNDQYESDGLDDAASDNDPIKQQQVAMRKDIAKTVVRTMLVNKANRSGKDYKYIEEFAKIDIDELSDSDFDTYESLLKVLMNNSDRVDKDIVSFVNKVLTSEFAKIAMDEIDFDRKYLDILNAKALPSNSGIMDWAAGVLPAIQLIGKDKLGNLSMYNPESIFEIATAMNGQKMSVLKKGITEQINNSYQSYLRESKNALQRIVPKGNFTKAQMHTIGFYGLLNQKPTFKLSGGILDYLSENGIDVSDLADGQLIKSSSTGSELEAYNLLKSNAMDMIKKSIMVSFGEIPEGWTKEQVDEAMSDVSVMSKRTTKEIKEEYDEILNSTGFGSVSELINAIEDGSFSLTSEEMAYKDELSSLMKDVKEGEYSNKVGLKDASEIFYGIDFAEIEDYFPMMRYKTYMTTEKYFEPDGKESDDNKVFYGLYNDFQMNTAFLEKRKESVMALQTNAYEAVRKRMDEQIFYLNNVEHQTYLKQLFRTDLFHNKGYFNTELSNQVIEALNATYNRGISRERADVMKSTAGNFLLSAIQKYKVFYIADWLKAPAQVSTVLFVTPKLFGTTREKFGYIADGASQMLDSYREGSSANKFLAEFAPEVYYRGLNTYDIAAYGDEVGNVSGVLAGRNKGLYKTSKSRIRNVASELKNPYSHFGSDVALAPMKLADCAAARSSFFAAYKSYCDKNSINPSFSNPDLQAVQYAIDAVRETQNTDNPLHKPGISYGLIPGGKNPLGDFNLINMLAFRAYSINERQTLMKASERLKNAIASKNWEEAKNQSEYFVYSFASKMLFQYIKIGIQKALLAKAASMYLEDDDTFTESISNASSVSNVALHTALDYFAVNDVAKWAATIGVKAVEDKFFADDDNGLSKEEQEKYRGYEDLDPNLASGLFSDIMENISQTGKEAFTTKDEETTPFLNTDAEEKEDELRFIINAAAAARTIPGSSVANDLLREIKKQRKMQRSGKSKGGSSKIDNTLSSPQKFENLNGMGGFGAK